MCVFTNITTLDQYKSAKEHIQFEHVPNTAAGHENSRKYITFHNHKYFVTALNERDYYISHDGNNAFSLWFWTDGDRIIIEAAKKNGRTEHAEKYLKKYAAVLAMVHSCIKYDRIINYA